MLAGRSSTGGRPREPLAQRRAVMRQQNSVTFPLPAADVVAMGRARPVTAGGGAGGDAVNRQRAGATSLAVGRGAAARAAGRVLAQLWHDDGPRGWLLLDEPTSALDLYWQQSTLRLLHRLTRNGRFSVCAVLHDLNLASLWSDRCCCYTTASWWRRARTR